MRERKRERKRKGKRGTKRINVGQEKKYVVVHYSKVVTKMTKVLYVPSKCLEFIFKVM